MKTPVMILMLCLCSLLGQSQDVAQRNDSVSIRLMSPQNIVLPKKKEFPKPAEPYPPGTRICCCNVSNTPPLWVVNGKALAPNSNKMQKLNPKKIKGVSVLKGSEALAKYGDLAKNGVVLIETKRWFQAK